MLVYLISNDSQTMKVNLKECHLVVNKDCGKKINIGDCNILGIKVTSNLKFEARVGDLCKKATSFFVNVKPQIYQENI